MSQQKIEASSPSASKITLEDVSASRGKTSKDNLIDEEAQDLEAARKRAELHDFRSNIEHRKKYSLLISIFVCLWMCGVFIVVLLNGWGFRGLKISDQVIIALIGGTTINVIGLFAIVANYFFPKK